MRYFQPVSARRSTVAFIILSLSLLSLCGCTPPNNVAIAQSGGGATQTGTASVLDADGIELRYVLPEQDVAAASTAAKWSLAAPMEGELSDPNRIVYDQAYMEKYVEWAANAEIACGPVTYVIITPEGERSFVSGQDEAYLGVRFKAEDLLAFLVTRTAGKRIERTFRVDNAEAAKVLRDHPESFSAKRLRESPWDRDTRAVIELLGLAQFEPACPPLVELAKDANADIRYVAIIALGRLGGGVPAAIEELEKLLDDEANRSTAADALAMSGEAALPAILRALDHPDWTARNHVVHSLGSHADPPLAAPALRKVMAHSDPEMREWGAAVVADLVSRGGPEAGKPYVAELAALLKEDPSNNTRRSAALALLNMKEFAAPAEESLRHAAAKEQDYLAQKHAKEALEGLKTEREQQP